MIPLIIIIYNVLFCVHNKRWRRLGSKANVNLLTMLVNDVGKKVIEGEMNSNASTSSDVFKYLNFSTSVKSSTCKIMEPNKSLNPCYSIRTPENIGHFHLDN